MTSKPIVFSGIQPSGGGLMLGNYLGALKNWVALQNQYDCYFCIVDLHTITVRQDPKKLYGQSLEALAIYIAAGLNPEKNVLFIQSHVHQHAELAWILECFTYLGELSRMTQFKDKSTKEKNVGVGLLTYPVLMASDILLYQTDLVPVGADQKQHLELVRDIAIRMNNLYGAFIGSKSDKIYNQLFKVPEAYIPPVGTKIMSLQDPNVKMSKSDSNPNATLFLSDTDDMILKKIKRAVTDSGSEITYSPEDWQLELLRDVKGIRSNVNATGVEAKAEQYKDANPTKYNEKSGIKNLIIIQAALLEKTPQEIAEDFAGKQYGDLKLRTAEVVIENLKPIRDKYQTLLKDKTYLSQVFQAGGEKAQIQAEKTLQNVKQAIGFVL